MRTTTSDVPKAIQEVYDRNLLERALPELVHNLFAQIRDIPRKTSDTIKFRKYNALNPNTTPLTQGITPQGKKLSATDITVQIKQYGDYVEITDEVDLFNVDKVLLEASDVLGEQAGQSLDIITRDVLASGTNVFYAGGKTARNQITSTDTPTYNDFLAIVRILEENNAKPITRFVNPDTGYDTTPLAPSFVGIVHPKTAEVIKKNISQFKPVEKYQAQAVNVLPGEIGAIDRIRLIQTSLAKVFPGEGSGGEDVYATIVLARNAYGVSRISGETLRNIVKGFGSAGSADPLEQRATSAWKATFAAAILQQAWLVRYEHAV